MDVGEKTNLGMRAREIFLDALDKASPKERAEFLDEACGRDPNLRARVEELLRSEAEVGGFLDTPAVSRPAALSSQTTASKGDTVLIATENSGDRIGRYRLLQKIGEGGAGIVYMAEQDEPVRRRVALKVIKLGMDTRSVIARFEAERQALAMMDHPNIARVLDGGATDLGRPFFVMELVRGVRITEYCDQGNLSTQQRLALFIEVCQAIQHAHQKGIIHRDIKPSNILVTVHDGVPVPKVIDFGIAKATEFRLTEKTLFTEFTAFIGTPAYMSPEQAEMGGLDIDTRSDIYALGVLLYELLVGKTPLDAESLLNAGLDECRRTIREKDPARPSTRLAGMGEVELTTTAKQRQIEAPKLVHLLSGDLDWIVMKCLEKDRARRYATANDLALDVQRYLDGEAILARPPSALYRFQKYSRRHRRTLVAVAAITMTLLAGAALSTWLAVKATEAEHKAQTAQKLESALRMRAERESRRAEQEKAAARLNEYVADINLAQQSLTDGNLGRAVQLLKKHGPQAGESDLRGFEWRYLWHLCQGDERVSLPPRKSAVQSIAASPTAPWLVAGLRDECVIWDMRAKTMVTNLHKGAMSMTFTPDGQRLITASMNTVRVWSASDWREQKALFENGGPVALSRSGNRLATLSWDGVRVWDTATWEVVRLLPDMTSPMALSPDGGKLVAESRSGAGLTLWNVDGNQPGSFLQDSTNLFARGGFWFRNDRVVAFSPDGKSVVAARNTLSPRGVFVLGVWNVESGREVATLPNDPQRVEHTGVISGLAFSPDGRTLATVSVDHSIRLWDWETRQRIGVYQGHLSEVWAAAFSADGRTLCSGAKDGSVSLWPLSGDRKEDTLPGNWLPVAFSSDNRSLAAHNREGTVAFFNLSTMEADRQLQLERWEPGRGPRQPGAGRSTSPGPPNGGPGPLSFGSFQVSFALSADFKTLAQAAGETGLKLWNTETREDTVLKSSDRFVDYVAMTPNGRWLVSGGRFQPLRFWDLRSGTNRMLETESRRVLFSGDSRLMAAFSERDVEIWDVAACLLHTNIVSEVQPGMAAAFSPNGNILGVACFDDVIRLWETDTGKLVGACVGHKQAVQAIAFAPDGRTLASASDDSTLKLWNVATQQELLSIRRLGGAVRSLHFSPDGQILATGSSFSLASGGIRFYRAPQLSETDRSGTAK